MRWETPGMERRENRCKQKIIYFIGDVIKVNNSEVIVKDIDISIQNLKKIKFCLEKFKNRSQQEEISQ